MDPLYLRSFRGGLNVTDPPSAIDDDQVVVCENLDFDIAPLGAKRQGSVLIEFEGLNLSGGAAEPSRISGLHRYLPSDDEGDAELIIEAQVPSGVSGEGPSANFFFAVTPEGWTALYTTATVADTPAESQSLHGKLFLTIPKAGVTPGSIDDRLYVYDPDTTGLTVLAVGGGTTTIEPIRPTGVFEPDAPSVADQGSGSMVTTRYYRVRGIIQIDGVAAYRSEPSESVEITPSGSGASVRVTRPAYMEGTHWEVEESLDDANFYRIATVVITTSTYDDSLPAAEVDDDETLLSEDIGDYTVIYSPAYVAADEDRLMVAGAQHQLQLQSRVAWTPVRAASGIGNDERFESDTDPFVDLDGFEGGAISALAGPVNGFMWAYKESHIYKLVRTGSRRQAYIAVPVTKANGAVPHSLVSGLDETGNVTLYTLDPRIGPMAMATQGLLTAGEDIRGGSSEGIWKRFNRNAGWPCHGVFYAARQQVWWWIAVDDSDVPNLKIVADVKSFRNDQRGKRRGWSTHTGTVQECIASVVFADNLRTVASGEPYSKSLKPFFGTVNPLGVEADVYEQQVGTYVGNGTTQDIGTNFAADVILVAPYNPTASISSNHRGGAFRTPEMTGSDSVIRAAQPAIITTGITAIGAAAFTVGAHDAVNKSGIAYTFIAIRGVDSPFFRTGTYAGNNVDDRAIEIEEGFEPTLVWIIGINGGASANGVIRQTGMAAGESVMLNSSITTTDLIQDFLSNGFEVGRNAAVNSATGTFYYMAWRDYEGRLSQILKTGKITGTGSQQAVTGVGFSPEYVQSTTPSAFGGVWKTPAL